MYATAHDRARLALVGMESSGNDDNGACEISRICTSTLCVYVYVRVYIYIYVMFIDLYVCMSLPFRGAMGRCSSPGVGTPGA